MNDNRKSKSMSPVGATIFDMLSEMTNAQARLYQSGASIIESTIEVSRLERLHRPKILNAFTRLSEKTNDTV